MDFLEKIDENPYTDIYWNIPEAQKRGEVAVIGGNAQNFRIPIKVAEYLLNNFPLKQVKTVLPDSLKSKLPPLDNLVFLDSGEAGTLSDEEGLKNVINANDFALFIGDLSKNAETKKAIKSAFLNSEKPVLLTRDTVDLAADEELEKILMRENLILMGPLVQWQKILKAVYYPKILLTSQSLMQVAEILHKFTLSYPVQGVILHEGQILVCKNGMVKVVGLEKTGYSPLSIWNGELAAKIVALNLYNPDKFVEATVAALFR